MNKPLNSGEALRGDLPKQPETAVKLLSEKERREPKFASAKKFVGPAGLYELIKK